MTIYTPIAGRKCKLYVNTGTFTTPVWTEAKLAGDVKLPRGTELTGVPVRASKFNLSHPVGEDIGVDFTYTPVKGMADTVFAKMYESKNSDDPAPIHIACCDGPIATAGTYVAELFGYLKKFDEGQETKNVKQIDCSFKPGLVFDGTTLLEPDCYIAE